MQDYAEIRAYWDDYPPPQIMLKIIASGLGAKFDSPPPGRESAAEELPAPAGPSIAEIAARIENRPIAKGDTLAASREVLAMMAGKGIPDGGE